MVATTRPRETGWTTIAEADPLTVTAIMIRNPNISSVPLAAITLPLSRGGRMSQLKPRLA